jgi:hypothetical protein
LFSAVVCGASLDIQAHQDESNTTENQLAFFSQNGF